MARDESYQRFRAIAETAPDAIFTIDETSTILFCNRAVERIFGWKAEELMGRNLDVIMAPSLRARHHHALGRYLSTGHRHIPWSGVELTALHRDGHEFPVEVSFGEFEEGSQRVFTGFVRDISDRKRAAEEMQLLLEQTRQSQQDAEAAVRLRDETLGIVSHDLRAPLAQIVLSADLLGQRAPGEHGELVENIRNSGRMMDRLIQDLLDVARLEAGRFSVKKDVLDVEEILRSVCESNRPLADRKGQSIQCNTRKSLPKICGDRDRILQVFANLVGNAIKFTPERGVIAIDAQPRNGEVVFHVRDSGQGIDDLRNVFQKHWQAGKTRHMGAGLGLSIVRGIVEAHGGTVWAENAPGGGAVFSFTIPVA